MSGSRQSWEGDKRLGGGDLILVEALGRDLDGVYGVEHRRGRGSCHGNKQGVVPRGVKRHDVEPRAWRGHGDDNDVHRDAVDPVRAGPRRGCVAHGGVL
jgi:hypothetical protein